MRSLASELGPHIERFTSQPRIYADANVPAGVVAFMRDRLGWDVFFVVEHDEVRRASDVEHYRLARKLRRTLVSLDRDFFDDRQFPMTESAGVIVLSAPDERGLTRVLTTIDRAFFGQRGRRRQKSGNTLPLVGQKVHVHPDWSFPDTPTSSRRRHR